MRPIGSLEKKRTYQGQLVALVRLLRPFNCVLAAVAALLGYAVSAGGLVWNPRLPAVAAVAFLICGAGQAINDYYDKDIDATGDKSSRPIPSGKVSARTVLLYSAALFLLGCAISVHFLPKASFLISVAYTMLLVAYSALFTQVKYLGNIVVASATGATYIFGAALTGNYLVALILALSAFASNIGREVAKDLEDQKIDKGTKTTLPMVIGSNGAQIVSAAGFVISVPLIIGPALVPTLANSFPQLIPWISGTAVSVLPRFTHAPFLAIIAIASAVMLQAAWRVATGSYEKSQKLAKIGMALGLVAYLAALAIG